MISNRHSFIRKNGVLLIIELVLIIIYLFIIQFSIVILPINIIFGIICVLFLPGYNLLNILKPRFNLIEKLGYMTMVSLAIDNIFMFFWYLIFYDIVTTPEEPGFIFNGNLLIISIQIINLVLISINVIYFYKEINKAKARRVQHEFKDKSNKIEKKNYYINLRVLIISIGFFFSLILLCISTLYSYIPNNEYSTNYNDYKSNFTFFYRVPFTFYIFLVSTILCLTYIIFFSKNKYFILICISIFIYCLWILPYLQIGNYFSEDTHILFIVYNNYLKYGIRTYSNFGYIVKFKTFTSFRYSTSLFTAILLASATGAHINFVLWFLYPLIFIFIPFFFYSIFKKFSNNTKDNNSILIILTFLAIFIPQIIKTARSAITGVIGTVLFFMIVLEFFDLLYQREFKFKIMNFIMIVLLYFLLCLTHFEECIYFLIIIALYPIYYLFTEVKKIEDKSPIKRFMPYSYIQKKYILKNLITIGFLLCILLLIFYLTSEFFGTLNYYFGTILGDDYENHIIYILYNENKIEFQPLLRGNLSISPLLIFAIILLTLTYINVLLLILFKFHGFFFKIFSNCKFFLIKIF
ncbi:MAG: hypothetical protein ACFFAH_11950, partial [Promethearchaeota archaeon]